MAITLVPYSEKYRPGIIICIRKNFKWLKQLSEERLNHWLDNIVSYNWEDSFKLNTYPFYHGAVVLENEKNVVGFLGVIYSNRVIENCEYTELNVTTWVINEDCGNRLFILKAAKSILDNDFYVTDLSAIPSVQKLNKRFEIDYFDEIRCIFVKNLMLKNKSIKGIFCNSDKDITVAALKTEFHDHLQYGVRCFKYISTTDIKKEQYIFYKTNSRKILGIQWKWIQILKVTDIDSFTVYVNEILKTIMCKEKVCLSYCDSHFLKYMPKGVRTKKISMMARMKGIQKENIDYLYTELAMVDMYAGSDITIKTILKKISCKLLGDKRSG